MVKVGLGCNRDEAGLYRGLHETNKKSCRALGFGGGKVWVTRCGQCCRGVSGFGLQRGGAYLRWAELWLGLALARCIYRSRSHPHCSRQPEAWGVPPSCSCSWLS